MKDGRKVNQPSSNKPSDKQHYEKFKKKFLNNNKKWLYYCFFLKKICVNFQFYFQMWLVVKTNNNKNNMLYRFSVYFFLETPTVLPFRPVVFVCWPLTRRLKKQRKPPCAEPWASLESNTQIGSKWEMTSLYAVHNYDLNHISKTFLTKQFYRFFSMHGITIIHT